MLSGASIRYVHRKDLAPTTELRRLQYAEDDRRGVGKRNRERLAGEYARRYSAEILAAADLDALVDELAGGHLGALLCVERDPEACHRSLIAERLRRDHGADVVDLYPPGD